MPCKWGLRLTDPDPSALAGRPHCCLPDVNGGCVPLQTESSSDLMRSSTQLSIMRGLLGSQACAERLSYIGIPSEPGFRGLMGATYAVPL